MTTVVASTSNRETGTGPSRRIREEGNIPGVVYGLGQDPVTVSVGYTALRDVLKGKAGLNTVFSLDIDGTPTPVILKDFQRNPVKRTVVHCDFLRVDNDVPVKVTLPVHLVGRATIILDGGGIVEQKMFQMSVQCAPNRIPISIEVDVSKLTPEARISVGDIVLPEGVEAMMSDAITVAAPVVTRASKMADEEEAEEEAAEAAAEAGEAPAEGTDDDE